MHVSLRGFRLLQHFEYFVFAKALERLAVAANRHVEQGIGNLESDPHAFEVIAPDKFPGLQMATVGSSLLVGRMLLRHRFERPALFEFGNGGLGLLQTVGLDMGKFQHPAPLAILEFGAQLVLGDIDSRGDYASDVFLDELGFPFNSEFLLEIGLRVQSLLTSIMEHQLHVDHGLQVILYRTESFLRRLQQHRSPFGEFPQVFDGDVGRADARRDIAVHLRAATEQR